MAELDKAARALNTWGHGNQHCIFSSSHVASLFAWSLVIGLGVGCAVGTQKHIPPSVGTTPAVGTIPHSTREEINHSITTAVMQSPVSSDEDYRIGREDMLQITLFNIPETEGRVTPRTVSVRVSQKGMIMLPLLGEILVKDLTVSKLEHLLRDRYVKYIRNPQVGVLVTEHRQRASVIGAVHKPGIYELTGSKTVLDLLVLAGGINDRAGSQVHLYRQGPQGRQSHVIDLVLLANSTPLIDGKNAELVNMPVQPGDVLSVPQAGMIFIDGAVGRPGSYPLGQRYTLTQALVTAGGVNADIADSSNISIYRRRGPTEVDTIPANLGEIQAKNVPDPRVEPDDVIVVPTSATRVLFRQIVGPFLGNVLTGISIGTFVRP